MPTMKPALVLISIVWSMTLVASVAAAGPKGYLQAGLMGTVQPAGVPNHRVTPPIDGKTSGLAAAVGFFVTPTVVDAWAAAFEKVWANLPELSRGR